MNVFNYKKSKIISPNNIRKHNMYRKKTPQKNIVLDDFVGKFKAKDKINCVKLKHEFKNGGV